MKTNHPPLPEGAVFLGKGGTFKLPESGYFKGWAYNPIDPDWGWDEDVWGGCRSYCIYAAPADSVVVRLNEIQYAGFDPCDSCENDLVCSDTGKCSKPAKQGEAHSALTTLEEMANMPGAGNNMDLWNRHSCAVLKMAAELAEARAALLKYRQWHQMVAASVSHLGMGSDGNDRVAVLAEARALAESALGDPDGKLTVKEVVERIPRWKPIETAQKDGSDPVALSEDEAMEAIIARINGVWDHCILRKFGPLGTCREDILRILKSIGPTSKTCK